MKLGPTLEERVRHLEDRVAIGELIAEAVRAWRTLGEATLKLLSLIHI